MSIVLAEKNHPIPSLPKNEHCSPLTRMDIFKLSTVLKYSGNGAEFRWVLSPEFCRTALHGGHMLPCSSVRIRSFWKWKFLVHAMHCSCMIHGVLDLIYVTQLFQTISVISSSMPIAHSLLLHYHVRTNTKKPNRGRWTSPKLAPSPDCPPRCSWSDKRASPWTQSGRSCWSPRCPRTPPGRTSKSLHKKICYNSCHFINLYCCGIFKKGQIAKISFSASALRSSELDHPS